MLQALDMPTSLRHAPHMNGSVCRQQAVYKSTSCLSRRQYGAPDDTDSASVVVVRGGPHPQPPRPCGPQTLRRALALLLAPGRRSRGCPAGRGGARRPRWRDGGMTRTETELVSNARAATMLL